MASRILCIAALRHSRSYRGPLVLSRLASTTSSTGTSYNPQSQFQTDRDTDRETISVHRELAKPHLACNPNDIVRIEHRAVEKLFTKVFTVSSMEEKQRVMTKITNEITRYITLSDKHLIPAIRQYIAADDAIELATEQKKLSELLSKLKPFLTTKDKNFPLEHFKQLIERMEIYTQAEEQLMRQLENKMSWDEFGNLGISLQTLKMQHMKNL